MIRFFIKNPVFSSVISIIIILCGIVAIFVLPLEEYPNITPPTITLSAHYPGASAKVLERTVASPIETQINGTGQMLYMNSTMSSNGDYNLIITFETGANLDNIIGDVLNRLNSALPVLPRVVQNLGVTMRKSSQNLLMSIAIQGNSKYDDVYLSNYVKRTIYSELSRIKGVGDVVVTGDRTYSMRIWLNPEKMAKLKITVQDVEKAITDQNIQVAAGKTGAPPMNELTVTMYNLNGPGYYSEPQQFENIIVRANGNQYVRIKDIAWVELGAQNYDTISKLDDINSTGLDIYLAPGANQLAVHHTIIDSMERLERHFPDGISYKIAFDNTKFIEKSLENVVSTLIEACVLVILVIFLFLQKGKATLIPILTIPVAIIGTFAGMLATGFSINNLTLFGLILSIGIVVDDSIVVIENIERIMVEKGVNAREASYQAMAEVSNALISIVLVLCCAFIPSAFLGGLTGVLYKQFAVTLAISVIISGIVALTLTPALCATILNNHGDFKNKNKFFLWFNKLFNTFTNKYIDMVINIIKYRILYLCIFIMMSMVTIIMYWYIPIGFIPNEDRGFFLTQITLPNNSSLDRSAYTADKYINYLQSESNIINNISIVGIDKLDSNSQKTNVASITSNLKDWGKRKESVFQLINKANKYGIKQKDAKFVVYNLPAVDGLSTTNGVEFYVEDKVDGNYNQLQRYMQEIAAKLILESGILSANYSFDAYGFEVNILANVDRAKYYGVNISDIYTTLETNFGPNLVNYFYKIGDLYWVTLQGDSEFRRFPNQLQNLFVKSSNGDMVPLSSITTTNFSSAPDVIQRFNGYLAAKMVVDLQPSYTINEVNKTINRVVNSILPRSYAYSLYGTSFQEQKSKFSAILAFGFGLILIFLVLAAQFEMWRLPIVVIMGVPFALFGAGIILLLRGLNNDLYFQISLITLLGLSAKNSILITEFAVSYCYQGLNTIDAIILAARQRFRPIIMTSTAFILGTIPLTFATGVNANAQHSIGSGILGGMIGSTFIATLFIPMFFVVVMGEKSLAINKD